MHNVLCCAEIYTLQRLLVSVFCLFVFVFIHLFVLFPSNSPFCFCVLVSTKFLREFLCVCILNIYLQYMKIWKCMQSGNHWNVLMNDVKNRFTVGGIGYKCESVYIVEKLLQFHSSLLNKRHSLSAPTHTRTKKMDAIQFVIVCHLHLFTILCCCFCCCSFYCSWGLL